MNGPAPLMLTGQPHEAADASSGQTQQVLETMPQHCNRHEQEHRADERDGLPSSAGEQYKRRDACCAGKHGEEHDPHRKEPDAAEGGAARCEEVPAADKIDEQQQHMPDAMLPHPEPDGPPAFDQGEVVDLISDSDDERAIIPASQATAPKEGQSVPAKGEPFSRLAPCNVASHAAQPHAIGTYLGRAVILHVGCQCVNETMDTAVILHFPERSGSSWLAYQFPTVFILMVPVLMGADGREQALRGPAVRRSGRISSQCNSDASESEEQCRRVKRSQAWLKGCKKREAEAQPRRSKKSRLGRTQQALASPATQQIKSKTDKAKDAAAGEKKGAKKAKKSPAETGQHKKQQVRQDPRDTKVNISARAGALSKAAEVPQDESSEWSSKPEGADQPLEQDEGIVQSGKAPVNAFPVGAAKAHAENAPSSAIRSAGSPAAIAQHGCKIEAADKRATPAQRSTHKTEDTKAVTSPSEATASGTAPASMTQASSPAKSKIPFSQADVGALLAAFEQNRCSQAATQSPAKKYKRSDKGKEKASEMPRDPQQPGPSDAVYCTPAGEVDESDDDSYDLGTPLT